MNCLIVYYSLTNSTAKIAEHIANGLSEVGYNVELCNIRNQVVPDLKKFDLLGIGTPVYYFQIPINVLECIEKFPSDIQIRTFAFLTNGSYAWNAGSYLKNALNSRGFDISAWFYSYGSDYFLPYLKLKYHVSPSHPNEIELKDARQFGVEVGKMSEVNSWKEMSQAPTYIYRLEQLTTNRVMIRVILQRLFNLKKKKCIKCGICIRECPVQNLYKNKDGFPVWGRNCIMCLNCESKCPENAILSPLNGIIIKSFMKYNMNQILRDSNLEKNKVL